MPRAEAWIVGKSVEILCDLLAVVLSCSACLDAATDAQFPEECPKEEPASDVALAWEPSYEGPIPDVIPALAPREEPLPPSQGGAAGVDDYPPPDRIPTASETPPPTALQPADNALAMAPPGDPGVIAALPPVQLPTRGAHQLLTINPQERPYKVNIPRVYVGCGERQYVSQIQICVSEVGLVSSVRILTQSIPIIDLQLPIVIGRWRYHPYLVDGRPTAFCYPLNYRVR